MRVELAGQKISFPSQCTCCGEPPDGENYVASVTQKSTTRQWQFPMCEQCQAHLAIAQSGAGGAVPLFFVVGVVGTYLVSWGAFVVGFILAVFLVKWTEKKVVAAQCPTCTSTGAPAKFEKWQGNLQVFEIPSDEYATALLRENAGKAVNLSSEAQEALAGMNVDLTRQTVR